MTAARGAAHGRAGTLDIGLLGTASLQLLPRIIPPFRAKTPDAELATVTLASHRGALLGAFTAGVRATLAGREAPVR